MEKEFLKQKNNKKACKLELLAPAQNKECAYAAIDFGADSVYIGANLFGARKNACNSLDDIKEIINYAHKFNVKIYVTINTILTDNELLEAIELIKKLHEIRADGIIFQDFGILQAAYDGKLPDIKLIASTQCDNREKEKVKFFEKLGIERAILARELSLSQIKNICHDTNLEIETFIHGALCVSYSGQCYLSHKIGKRSANRGECAQACRKKYSLIDEKGKIIAKDKYLLSLKDFMAKDSLEELIDIGVTSFKIEGRLKDSNYIKNTVLYYRRALDEILRKKGLKKSSSGKIFLPEKEEGKAFEPNPAKSFNRDFCDYFLSGKRTGASFKDKNPVLQKGIWNFDTPNSKGEFLGQVKFVGKNYFTISPARKGVEIHPQDGLCYVEKEKLCGMLVNSVKKEYAKKDKQYIEEKIYPNVMPKIQTGCEIFRNKDSKFENALKNLKAKRQIGVNFKVFKGYIEAQDEDEYIITFEFNANEPAKNKNTQKKAWAEALQKTGGSDFYTSSVEFTDDEIYFLPKSEINELRRKILENLMNLRLESYMPERQKQISPAKFPKNEGDYRLNIHNRAAQSFYEKCGCSVLETSFEDGRKPLKSHIAHACAQNPKDAQNTMSIKKAELMRTKHCIRYALNMCLKNSPKETGALFLVDEKGQKYPLNFDCKNCEMIIKEN